MGRRSESGGVRPQGDRIEVDLTWQGKRIKPTLPLKPTTANLKAARRMRADMLDEIKSGTFNIHQHFPDYKFAAKLQAPDEANSRTFKDWGDVWAKLKARELEHSTLSIYKNHLAAYWTSVWGDLPVRQITNEMILTRLAELAEDRFDEDTGVTHKGLSRKTQNNILIPLRGVLEVACKALKIADPSDGVNCLRVQTGDPDPFTMEEVEIILADLRKPRGKMTQAMADELADYYEFAAFAGLRPSEQIALEWGDTDKRTKTIHVRRASVLRKVKERTKTHRARIVELNDRAWAVIERQRARTSLAGKLVFINPFTRRPWATGEEQRREWVDCLRRVGIRHRPPKELRDTSVTLALTSGADPWWVARMHGHSIQTMQKDYAKWMPKADGGRNVGAMNRFVCSSSVEDEGQQKSR